MTYTIGITDHDLVHCMKKCKRPKLPPKYETFWNWKIFDQTKYHNDCANFPLNNLTHLTLLKIIFVSFYKLSCITERIQGAW